MSYSNFLSDIQEMLVEAIPDCQICETSPELISDMLAFFMNDVIKRTNREKQNITANNICDVLENTPEFGFLLDCVSK